MPGALEPSATFATYRIERLLGRGGMGAVYSATRVADGTTVALKVIGDEHTADPGFMGRFEREGRLAADLRDPHLVEVHEAGTWEGVPYLAMALIDGIDLEYVLATEGSLHPVTAATIVAQVGSGLDIVHAAGLIHRDVKPGNILLERGAVPVHSRLTDFGLARRVDSTSGLTKTGHWIGTVDYAAPEQIQAADTDARADVYALGCVLFETLTGRVPYPAARDVDKLIAHASGAPPNPSEQRDGVPPEFDGVVAKAMARDPHERFPTAGALGEAARQAAKSAGPEPPDPIRFPATAAPVDTEAPTAG